MSAFYVLLTNYYYSGTVTLLVFVSVYLARFSEQPTAVPLRPTLVVQTARAGPVQRDGILFTTPVALRRSPQEVQPAGRRRLRRLRPRLRRAGFHGRRVREPDSDDHSGGDLPLRPVAEAEGRREDRRQRHGRVVGGWRGRRS